jgi:murein DD-endopeptidase MepM/ murein hydrolase activator NlpD
MNVVIFGKGLGKPRQLNLSGPLAAAAVLLVAAVVAMAGFAGGHWYAASTGSGVSSDEMAGLVAELQEAREHIETIRQEHDDTLDAMAFRIAQMNARMIRLDALGRRLTEMANLEDGEFDFDELPAMGGPEEPMATGSNVAVPDVVEAMQTLDLQLDSREAQLGVLESVIANQNLKQRVYPQGRPVSSGWISSYFGKRTDPFTGKPANHTGIDFAGKSGADVIAVADGVVTWSSKRYGYGLMVEINHGNGYTTRYAHNSENLVAVGEEVKKGQVVAKMGETGRATGPNLHFEVLQDGRRMNPVNFIRATSN